MIATAVRGILLDIEGTTSSIRFVYEQLFPYARRELRTFLSENWETAALQAACAQVARDVGAAGFGAWCAEQTPSDPQAALAAHLLGLMEQDSKATGLKLVQGLIWQEGYRLGRLRSHVYPDVPPALAEWQRRGLDVRIYSSGSMAAQRVFFQFTEAGDLTTYLRGHYDTTIGAKRAAASYSAIARDMGLRPHDILFLSDVAAELDAARATGVLTALVVRPGNVPVTETLHPQISSFAEVDVRAIAAQIGRR